MEKVDFGVVGTESSCSYILHVRKTLNGYGDLSWVPQGLGLGFLSAELSHPTLQGWSWPQSGLLLKLLVSDVATMFIF